MTMERNILIGIYRRRKHFSRVALFFLITYSVQVALTFFVSMNRSRLNYFPDGDDYLKLGFIVNTPACRILNNSAWDKSILPLLSSENPWPDCGKNWEWTFTENSELIINTTAVYESGYSLKSISCCYRAIERIHQNPEKYDKYADLRIKYSKSCKPMNVTNPLLEDEFIEVRCTSKYWPQAMDVVYRNFHAVPLLTKTAKTMKKMLYWKSHFGVDANSTGYGHGNSSVASPSPLGHRNHIPSEQELADSSNQNRSKHHYQNLPPNVVILGLDSMSRLSFQRNMKKTREYLQHIGAVEMLGYNKVGEGTFPNVLAFLSGYQYEALKNICMFSPYTKQDLCPFIWKKFGETNYLTLLLEDGKTFNYYKTGFVEQPTDFYFLPFIFGMRAHHPRSASDLWALNCIGGKNLVEIILKYINDAILFTSRNNTPVFVYSMLSTLAHDDMNGAQFADRNHLDFLQNLDLSNTILFVLGDHGYRYDNIRETFAGWLEDKLPTFWVYLPEKIRRRFPTWLLSLQLNSMRLTSPLDFYHTLVQILTTFTSVEKFPDAKSKTGEIIHRKHGQTLFEDVPATRVCRDAGITENYCACGLPRRLPTNNKQIIAASKKALAQINHKLPKHCSRLEIQKITAGGMVDNLVGGSKENNVTYVVAFETSPGGFLFEATLGANVRLGTYEVIGDLQRLNRIIKSHVGCVRNAFLERFCYCMSSGS